MDPLDRLMTEIHANIEVNAEKAVQKIQMGEFGVSYPPNGGLSKAEKKALSGLDAENEATATALKKIIADAMYSTLYKLMIDMDNISEPEVTPGTWEGIKLFYGREKKALNENPLLNISLGDAYWKWVKVRKLKSPRMDNAG